MKHDFASYEFVCFFKPKIIIHVSFVYQNMCWLEDQRMLLSVRQKSKQLKANVEYNRRGAHSKKKLEILRKIIPD